MKIKEITEKPKTGKQLLTRLKETGIIGMWADRDDIKNSSEFSRALRKQSQKREIRRMHNWFKCCLMYL